VISGAPEESASPAKISGERTHFGKFMTGVTRKKTGELTCMDDVQLYRVHVYRNHPHGLSECLKGASNFSRVFKGKYLNIYIYNVHVAYR
jgi:hypothetical protein